MKVATLLFVCLAAFGCAESVDSASARCATATFELDTSFAGARGEYCRILSPTSVALLVAPENQGEINDSPWYAFRLIPNRPGTAEVTLQYTGGDHRYWPKISHDGDHWTRLKTNQVSVLDNALAATLSIPLTNQTVWIAGQELLPTAATLSHVSNAVTAVGGTWRLLGESHQKRNIFVGQTNPAAKEWILLVGRQHPPEVTGALAMHSFVTTLTDNTDLGRRFRERFNVIVVPVVNPDGIANGHWRHNALGADLNRDWGPFRQPETQLIKRLIDQLQADQRPLRLFLDFHSTNRNIFYTQTDEDATDPPQFARRWTTAAGARLPDYKFERSQRHNQDLPTAKNYIYSRFGIAAITYEVGDETDRELIDASAEVFAEEMMRILLSEPHQSPPAKGR